MLTLRECILFLLGDLLGLRVKFLDIRQIGSDLPLKPLNMRCELRLLIILLQGLDHALRVLKLLLHLSELSVGFGEAGLVGLLEFLVGCLEILELIREGLDLRYAILVVRFQVRL